jgi:AcrR family transcriptional regulator
VKQLVPDARYSVVVTRKDDILAAAAELFADRGYDSVGMDDLGAAVGVTGPALYYYFPGKAQLLASLLLPSSERLAREADAIVRDAADAHTALAHLVRLHVRFVVENPSLATIHANELRNLSASEQEHVQEFMRGYVSTWSQVVQTGSSDPDPLAARALVQATFAMINGAPLLQLSAAGRDVAAFLTTLIVATLSAFVPGLSSAMADYEGASGV